MSPIRHKYPPVGFGTLFLEILQFFEKLGNMENRSISDKIDSVWRYQPTRKQLINANGCHFEHFLTLGGCGNQNSGHLPPESVQHCGIVQSQLSHDVCRVICDKYLPPKQRQLAEINQPWAELWKTKLLTHLATRVYFPVESKTSTNFPFPSSPIQLRY